MRVSRLIKPAKKGLRLLKKYQLAVPAPAKMLKREKVMMPARLALSLVLVRPMSGG